MAHFIGTSRMIALPSTAAARPGHRGHVTNRSAGWWLSGLLVLCGPAASVIAQNGADVKDPSQQVQTPFAAGVLIEIPPAPKPEETNSGPFPMSELEQMHPEIAWQGEAYPEGKPHFQAASRTLARRAQSVTLRREIYCLEFSFKPLRQIFADVPAPGGQTQRKLVTYMVFRLRYRGNDLRPATERVGDADLYERIEAVSYPSKRGFPILELVNRETGRRVIDRLLPSVKEQITRREQIVVPLYNTVEIGRQKIPLSRDPEAPGVWGLATWTDVDPDIDFLSVDVFGLTNAFEIDDLGSDSQYRRKALSLNFFRPGDAVNPTEDKIRFGVPPYSNPIDQQVILDKYGLEERLDYRWIFR
ncbi:hypothetical protein [Crateriforma conspicua]|nr:hypothetical protein [Crateriforma conspicua]